MTDQETAWLAGLLEGEGCFTLHSGRYPVIVVQMQDVDVIERAARLLGDRPVYTLKRRNKAKRDSYSARVQGKKAIEIMELVLPFMGDRRTEKIEEILASF